MKVLKIWDKIPWAGEPARASEKGIGMVRSVLWGDSFWQHCPGELAPWRNKAGGKEVSWEVTGELVTMGLRRKGGT